MAATARRLFAALLLAARPARAAFYSVSAAAGSLASPTALFAALSADATFAVDAALNSTCYADAAAERAAVAAVPAWDLVNGSAKGEPDAVHRLFLFQDFRTAALFMSQAALVFDRNDHHPVQTNVYNSVDVSLSTDDRKCLSTFDVATAGALDAIFARLQAAPAGAASDAGAEAMSPGAAVSIAVATLCCAALVVGAYRYIQRDGAIVEGGNAAGGGGRYGAI